MCLEEVTLLKHYNWLILVYKFGQSNAMPICMFLEEVDKINAKVPKFCICRHEILICSDDKSNCKTWTNSSCESKVFFNQKGTSFSVSQLSLRTPNESSNKWVYDQSNERITERLDRLYVGMIKWTSVSHQINYFGSKENVHKKVSVEIQTWYRLRNLVKKNFYLPKLHLVKKNFTKCWECLFFAVIYW